MSETGGVLDVVAIEKSFGAVSVLRGVSFSVTRGSVHALLGENGAGKSTLMRIVLGVEHADRGAMALGGAPYSPRMPLDARRSGVVMVPQERTLCPDLTVRENVVLGVEPACGGFVRRTETRVVAERALELVTGAARSIPLDVRVRELGVAEQQLIEIARALAQASVGGTVSARVLVLDEPTSSLGHDDAARLFERIAALREGGLAIVLVTHFLGDVRRHADRYTVLRDGTVQGSGDPKTTSPAQIVREMGASSAVIASPSPATPRAWATPVGDVLLEVKQLGGRVRPQSASFELRRGEVLGIAGLVGSGRTELLRLIVGLDRPARGEVRRTAPRGVGLLSEDRGGEGLMLRRSIAENVTLSPRGPLFSWPSAVRAEGGCWIAELAIKASGPDQMTGDLSGGNQQKVQLARLLREDYDVLLVDEPTRGIDVVSKAQVLALVRRLAAAGKGVVLVSSQLDELVTTCDRIAVLRHGELGAPRPAADFSEEKLLLEASA